MYTSNSILKEMYTNSSMTVRLHKESNKMSVRRVVRQGDSISPIKLFMAALESRKYNIPMTDLGKQRPEDTRRIS